MLQDEARGELSDWPEFVPKIEIFVKALADAPMPLATQAMLMQHYDRQGEFGKAEDMLFSMMEDVPDNPGLLELGTSFYRRLLAKSDDALIAGNLPRAELETGLSQLTARKP